MSLILNGFSYHLPRESYFNERNSGYGLQFDEAWGRHHVMAAGGNYLDSYYTQATYFGGGYNYRAWETQRADSRWYLDAGAVLLVAQSRGYRKYYHVPWLVAPLPWVAVGSERIALNLMFAPAPNDRYASVLTAQVKLLLF